MTTLTEHSYEWVDENLDADDDETVYGEFDERLGTGRAFLSTHNPARGLGRPTGNDVQDHQAWSLMTPEDQAWKNLCPCNIQGHRCASQARCNRTRVCVQN